MDIQELFGKQFTQEWEQFVSDEQLSEKQAEQFLNYMVLLRQESEKINITTITNPQDILLYHFKDSLQLKNFVDMQKIRMLCDIGTGGGFPGIPLKIAYPHISLMLIEVNQKKLRFLQRVVDTLGLENCEFYESDWRTFLRTTDYEVDLFCARASLQPEELVRMFSGASPYKKSQLVYWAAGKWIPDKKTERLVCREFFYQVGNRRRKLVSLCSQITKE